MVNAEYASDIIDHFRGIRVTGNIGADLSALMTVYRIDVASTPSKHKLLCK